MDEIGRGTSTFDGLSLAWAVARHLATRVRAFTLFATHYFEITALAGEVEGCANAHLDATEHGESLVFLHAVKPGPANRSYGLTVAQLAGVPRGVIAAARRTLAMLEAQRAANTPPGPQAELPLFDLPGTDVAPRTTGTGGPGPGRRRRRVHSRRHRGRRDHGGWGGARPRGTACGTRRRCAHAARSAGAHLRAARGGTATVVARAAYSSSIDNADDRPVFILATRTRNPVSRGAPAATGSDRERHARHARP